MALAAGAGASIEVRGGVDFLLARGLELLVVLLLLVVLVLLLLVHGLLRGGLVVLLGSSGGREGSDVGLEVGELARLGWRRLVDGVCFAEWWVRTRVLWSMFGLEGCSYREPWFFSLWKRRKFQGGRRLSRS